MKAGRDVSIDFYYSGTPERKGRFGTFTFGKDPKGRPWIYTSCEGPGASMWWPNKDQWRDKPDSMDISVAIPNGLVDVSNGRFVGKKDLGDGYTRWDWHVSYPINNYNVSLNIGAYEHFSDKLNDLTLDFYALPEDLDKAKKQFAQANGMLNIQHYFGEYPFKKDGYKLIQVPYSRHGTSERRHLWQRLQERLSLRDWTGVGISPQLDFIIIHERPRVVRQLGQRADAPTCGFTKVGRHISRVSTSNITGARPTRKYLNGYKARRGKQPIIPPPAASTRTRRVIGISKALFINTLRSIVNDDRRHSSS